MVIMVRRRGNYIERPGVLDVIEAQGQTLCDSTLSMESSHQLAGDGLISGHATATKYVALQIENDNAQPSSKGSNSDARSNDKHIIIGITDRPQCKKIGPRGSKEPKKVSASSSRTRRPSFSRHTSRSSNNVAKMLTIEEDEEIDLGRSSC